MSHAAANRFSASRIRGTLARAQSKKHTLT
jgi:hypothetical protein